MHTPPSKKPITLLFESAFVSRSSKSSGATPRPKHVFSCSHSSRLSDAMRAGLVLCHDS